MTFVPKNAAQILKSKQLQRKFFLKPYGLDTPKNANFPLKGPTIRFADPDIVLHHPSSTVSDNILVFKGSQDLTKPIIKQFLGKLYNIDIQRVNTARFMGKVTTDLNNKPMLTKPFKKIYVTINQKVPISLNHRIRK